MNKHYFLSLLIGSVFTIFSANADVTVHVATAGTLETVLFDQTQEEFADIAVLTITGSLNNDDIEILMGMTTDYGLRKLNLADANITNNTLANRAFKGSLLTHITLPKSLKVMGIECFNESVFLESVQIPTTGLTELSEHAFVWCKSLTEINIPEGVTTVGKECFVFCLALKKVTLPSTITTIRDGAFLGGAGHTDGSPLPITEFYIKATTVPTLEPAGICLMGGYWSITTLYVPTGTLDAYKANVYDGWYGFGMIQNIVEKDFNTPITEADVTVTLNVTTPGTLMAEVLAQTQVNPVEIVVLNVTGSLNNDDIAFLNAASIGYAVRKIDLSNANVTNNALANEAFKGSKLTHVILPKSLTTMGVECFYGSVSLQSIQIPTIELKEIPEHAFVHCRALTEINIPEGVTTIGKESFVFCISLKKVTLPSTITTIKEGAFLGGAGHTADSPLPITEFYIKAATVPTLEPAGVCLAGGYWTMCTLHVPLGSKAAYQVNIVDGWYGFGMIQNIVEKDFNTSLTKNSNTTDIKVYSHSKGMITVDGVAVGAHISIYNTNGVLQRTVKATSSKELINMVNPGLYILKCGNKVIKFNNI